MKCFVATQTGALGGEVMCLLSVLTVVIHVLGKRLSTIPIYPYISFLDVSENGGPKSAVDQHVGRCRT